MLKWGAHLVRHPIITSKLPNGVMSFYASALMLKSNLKKAIFNSHRCWN